jgi:hypothetical protein
MNLVFGKSRTMLNLDSIAAFSAIATIAGLNGPGDGAESR